MSDKIIYFPKKTEEMPEGTTKIVINYKIPYEKLTDLIDELWMNVYTNQQIEHLYADDDGNIDFTFKQGKYLQRYNYDNLIEHLSFIGNFINEIGQSHIFLEKYEEFINELKLEPIFATKKAAK